MVLAGKGHETYQDIAGVKHPFDEKVIVSELLEEIARENRLGDAAQTRRKINGEAPRASEGMRIMQRMMITLLIAFAVGIVLGKAMLPVLHKLKFGQNIYELAPEAHKEKAGYADDGRPRDCAARRLSRRLS